MYLSHSETREFCEENKLRTSGGSNSKSHSRPASQSTQRETIGFPDIVHKI